MLNLKSVLIIGVGVGMLAAASAYGAERTHEQELCEDEGICAPAPGTQPPVKYLHPGLYEPFETGIAQNAADIRANSAAIAQNAQDIASNTAGIAAALSLAAMQHNPNYEGLQTSFGLGYWDGEVGYGALVGQRLSEKVYGNVGVVGGGSEVGAVMSVTVQW
jgi:hypothetical protein